jgi:MFS family permease
LTAAEVPPLPARHRAFSALRHPGFRLYFGCVAITMTADFVEHVISYWVTFQKFHSAALGGFAVVSHWLPFLTLSIYAGGLADRFDPRRIIQVGMLVFMGVSIGWGLLFLSGAPQMWQAMLLLVVHGVAGVLWNPSGQLLLHDMVAPEELQSAVRLGATARNLGMLVGPGVGAALLLALGAVHGIFVNALLYLPMLVWLWKAPYGPRFRPRATVARAVRGFGDVFATLRVIRDDRTLLSMMLLAGGASFFIGNAYQAQMPAFAQDLGHGDPGVAYGMLLGADALGALSAGIILESRGLLPPSPRAAFALAMLWAAALGSFALVSSYPVTLALLCIAGFVELSFNSMAQTLVQLNAPAAIRGRVIGVYAMQSLGMRTFSGLTVGIVGGLIGIHWSLALSAAAFLTTATLLLTVALRPAGNATT